MMHRLQRMEAAMERFLGTGPMVSEEDDEDMRLVDEIFRDDEDQSTNTEPPELPTDAPYKEYLERLKTLRREEGHTYERLNAIWKQIFKFTQAFFVTATVTPATLTRNQGAFNLNDEIEFSIHLDSELFTADLQFKYIEDKRDTLRWIEYASANMKLKRDETNLTPIVFKQQKMLYEAVVGQSTPYDLEAEHMDALFVAYDVLSNLQRVLRYNKVLVAVQLFRPHVSPQMPGDLSDTAKEIIFETYRKQAEEAATNLLRSLLLQCRPGFTPPMSLTYARRNTMTRQRAEERAAAGRP